jgi:predicted  nucleic acid-binding Zn-ribbon protein
MKKEKTIGELAQEYPNKTYNELDKMRPEAGVCIIGEARKDRESESESELDRTKRDNNDLYNRVAELMEINESHQKLNGKLQERLTEVEEENKKLHDHFNKKIDSARKAGS